MPLTSLARRTTACLGLACGFHLHLGSLSLVLELPGCLLSFGPRARRLGSPLARQESLEVAHREGGVLTPVPGADRRAARDQGDRGGRAAAVLGSSEHGAVSVRVARLSRGGGAGLVGARVAGSCSASEKPRAPAHSLPACCRRGGECGEIAGLQPQSSFCSTCQLHSGPTSRFIAGVEREFMHGRRRGFICSLHCISFSFFSATLERLLLSVLSWKD